MTRFEFTSVLVSIVLAFGLSEVPTAWGRIIRHRQQLSISWPYVLVSVWVVLTIIMHWFGLWSYREVAFDRALYSFIVLSPSLVIALVCHILTPELEGSQSEQLEQHYFLVSRWALPLCSLHMLLAAPTWCCRALQKPLPQYILLSSLLPSLASPSPRVGRYTWGCSR